MEKFKPLSSKEILKLYKEGVLKGKTDPKHRKINSEAIEVYLIDAVEFYQKHHKDVEKRIENSNTDINYSNKVGP